MWLHTPELSINLAQVLRIIPTEDGKLQIVQPDNITVTVEGEQRGGGVPLAGRRSRRGI